MQPNEEKTNYWKQDPQSDRISGTYQPSAENSVPKMAASAQGAQTQPTANSQNSTDQPSITKNGEDEQNPTFKHLEPIHWTAKEYIDEQRGWMWFVLFFVVVIGLIALDIFFIKAYTFSALVIVMAIALFIYIKRPPRDINYTLSAEQGLYIGERLYHFSEFKAFGIITDRGHYSIMLIPTKRFQPGISVYFPQEVGEKVVDILGSRLPMKTLKLDTIDLIVRKLRL